MLNLEIYIIFISISKEIINQKDNGQDIESVFIFFI